MAELGGTKTIERPDGSEVLQLQRVRLKITKGPDKGAELLVDQPTVVIGTAADCDLRLTDASVSARHAQLRATETGVVVSDLGSTNGVLLGKVRAREVVLSDATTLVLGETTLRIAPTNDTVELPLSRRLSFGRLLGESDAMRYLFAVLERVASSSATVLLFGESGTGKELAAEALHQASPRADQPFVTVDCSAIPEQLMESELFGHERGAFTGASQRRIGAFEQADGGTLFLDEIGELPLDLQPKLLRVLESRKLRRVGGSEQRSVDVRIVAATNRSLQHEVERRRFRKDLLFRLDVVRITLPPLRERRGDIALIARHFAEEHVRDPSELLSEGLLALLRAYDWPGNVREMRNVVKQLALVQDQALARLLPRTQPSGSDDGQAPSTAAMTPDIGALLELPFHDARSRWQEIFERQYVARQLARADGVVLHAAENAQLPRPTFHRLLRRHGLRGG
ncbi:MAG: sigma 54-dependent Fis family transcriptional regulator [Myxococcales bacterium]|nr:sigma 54-dependent Fis family transcriptional regulator [Myxococcales bacterium]